MVLLGGDVVVPACVVLLQPGAWLVMITLALTMMVTFAWLGLYRRRFTESVLDDLPTLGLGLAAGAASAAAVATAVSVEAPLWWAVAASALMVLVGRWVLYAASQDGRLATRERVLVLGSEEAGRHITHAIGDQAHPRLRFVGRLSMDPDSSSSRMGAPETLHQVIAGNLVDVVLVAGTPMSEGDLVRCIRRGLRVGVRFYTVPSGYSMRRWRGPEMDRIGALPVLPLTGGAQGSVARSAKRLGDIVLSGLALVIAAPILIATAVAVRIEGGPRVILRRVRIGHGGAPFMMYKFRSMSASEAESETRWSVEGDMRIGPVGRFIRATSIDELPQLINVLRGDMSIVGPRPERPHFVEQFTATYPDYADRVRAPAGLTGEAAVRGLRGDTSIEHRALVDNLYIDNWSLWEDLKIIARTVGVVAGRRGR